MIYSVQSSAVAASHMWLLSTWSVAVQLRNWILISFELIEI